MPTDAAMPAPDSPDPSDSDTLYAELCKKLGVKRLSMEDLRKVDREEMRTMFQDIVKRRTERADETTRRERETGEARSRASHPSAIDRNALAEDSIHKAYHELLNVPVHPVHPTPVPLPGNIALGSILLQSTRSCPNCSGPMLHAHCAGADCRALYCSGCTCVWRVDVDVWFVRTEVDG